jgi:hypothetical protein
MDILPISVELVAQLNRFGEQLLLLLLLDLLEGLFVVMHD